ncbi:efflux ABC transporter, permease protein [Prevotella sp. DNF00663]|uniref:cell division protein FtsX n=1 Tax=unclassified Prevotella TaxID=2638335 RepID=UPI000513C1DC|nr:MULTISPECIES: permease-like cell division protein FtsX [unclassified Prevotella]KGI59702.1 cell division protein FtsX [Prevotella sp. S7 MS 2]KXB81339.1 efflux ABC transporter, permease protein [Prevotella sp. DNF00663]
MGKKKNGTRNPRGLQVVTLCISTALVLILLGMVVFSVLTAKNLSNYVKENLMVTMMLQDDMTNPEAKQLCQSLQNRPYINTVHFISKEEALKEQTLAMGTDPSEFIGGNPFLASIEVRLKADYANSDSLKWITKELKRNSKVSDITYQQDLMDSVNTHLRRISIVLLVLAALLTFVSFSLISNTVRLSIYARRFSIHTMKLVGASWSFIRKPFIKRNVVIGVVAALLADVVLGGMLFALYAYEPGMLTVVTWQVMAITGASVFLFGIIITAICANISVNKFLRMKAGDLYKI